MITLTSFWEKPSKATDTALNIDIKKIMFKAVLIMRIPVIKNYNTDSEYTTVPMEELCIPRASYVLTNNRDKVKFIKTCEILVRTSLEYRDLIDYLRTKMGMNFCSFFHNVSKDSFKKTRIRIEIHHEPFTLYDIVSIVLNKHLEEKKPEERIEMLDIAEEVMGLHYDGYVGLLPLSETVHELVHSGKLFVPLQFIDEGFNTFYTAYKKYIDDALKPMLVAKVALSKQFAENPDEFISILKKKYIYVVNQNYDSIPDKQMA